MNPALGRFVKQRLPGPLRCVARFLYYPLYRIFVWAWCAWTGISERLLGNGAGTHPLPPPRLRFRMAGSPSRDLFLEVGKHSSEEMEASLDQAGRPLASFGSILDFGCGCGRTLIWLAERYPATVFQGADVDAASIQWCKQNVPLAEFNQNRPLPPLDYSDETFDLVYAISVFTHLSEEFQLRWIGELRRILKPGGVLLSTVYSKRVWERLDATTVTEIKQKGILFQTSDKLKGICPAWYQTALATEEHVKATFSRQLRVLKYLTRGMGDLDVVVAERPTLGRADFHQQPGCFV